MLKRFFGTDNFIGPQCHLQSEGSSFVEPKRSPGHPEYIKGLNDIPNTGAASLGYAPGKDVVLCWDTWTAAANQAAVSRWAWRWLLRLVLPRALPCCHLPVWRADPCADPGPCVFHHAAMQSDHGHSLPCTTPPLCASPRALATSTTC